MIEFTVYGSPNSLKRHRSFNNNGKVIMYDPNKGCKQDFLAQAIKSKPDKPLSSPLSLEIRAYFPRPKNHYNKKGLKKNAPFFHSKIPDADNVLKFVGDALNQVFWADDKYIAEVVVRKLYDEIPRLELKIKLLEE